MILNVSGRTDVVAFYSTWFKNRLDEGFFDVRNPFNKKLVSRIYLSDVELIVFCTKNPINSLSYIKDIKKPIYYMVTITGYKNDIEFNVNNKQDIINSVKEIAKIIGKENVALRYDPILLNDYYNIYYHEKALEKLLIELKDSISSVIISFIDEYKNTKKNYNYLKYHKPSDFEYSYLANVFNKFEEKYNIPIQTCLEDELLKYGFKRGECISQKRAFEMTGKVYKKWKERDCGCASIVDIGAYNSCLHHCKYCYANFNEDEIKENYSNHDPNSSLLIGSLDKESIIKRRYE